MRKTAAFLVAALLAAAVSASALAAGHARPAPPKPAPPTNRPEQPQAHWFAGSVSSISGSSLSVLVTRTGPRDGQLSGQTVSVAVDSGTVIVKGRDKTPIQLSDIQSGQLIGVLAATQQGGDLTQLMAKRLHVWDNYHWAAGSVGSVSGNSLSVQVERTGPKDGQLKGQTVTLAVDSSTAIVKGKGTTPIQLTDLQPGDRVGLVFQASGSDLTQGLTAKRIALWGENNHWAGGTVSSVGTSSIAISVLRTGPHDTQLKGQSITVAVGSSTALARGRDRTPIQLSDIKTGDRLGILFHAASSDLSQNLSAIHVRDWGQKQPVPESTIASGSTAAAATDASSAATTASAATTSAAANEAATSS